MSFAIPRTILAFGAVGTLGFMVDTAALYLLRGLLGLYVARLVSFLCAAAVTWLLNRHLTFARRRSSYAASTEMAVYILLMMVGGMVNYGLYAWLVTASPTVAEAPVLGVAAGSLAGMAVNLTTSRFLLFRHEKAAPPSEPAPDRRSRSG